MSDKKNYNVGSIIIYRKFAFWPIELSDCSVCWMQHYHVEKKCITHYHYNDKEKYIWEVIRTYILPGEDEK